MDESRRPLLPDDTGEFYAQQASGRRHRGKRKLKTQRRRAIEVAVLVPLAIASTSWAVFSSDSPIRQTTESWFPEGYEVAVAPGDDSGDDGTDTGADTDRGHRDSTSLSPEDEATPKPSRSTSQDKATKDADPTARQTSEQSSEPVSTSEPEAETSEPEPRETSEPERTTDPAPKPEETVDPQPTQTSQPEPKPTPTRTPEPPVQPTREPEPEPTEETTPEEDGSLIEVDVDLGGIGIGLGLGGGRGPETEGTAIQGASGSGVPAQTFAVPAFGITQLTDWTYQIWDLIS